MGRDVPHRRGLLELAGRRGVRVPHLPIVSYYEIGTAFTANHAHGAMMGVYGMLAIGFFMFIAQHFIRPDRGSEWAMKLSFWGLNAGLALMLCAI